MSPENHHNINIYINIIAAEATKPDETVPGDNCEEISVLVQDHQPNWKIKINKKQVLFSDICTIPGALYSV